MNEFKSVENLELPELEGSEDEVKRALEIRQAMIERANEKTKQSVDEFVKTETFAIRYLEQIQEV